MKNQFIEKFIKALNKTKHVLGSFANAFFGYSEVDERIQEARVRMLTLKYSNLAY